MTVYELKCLLENFQDNDTVKVVYQGTDGTYLDDIRDGCYNGSTLQLVTEGLGRKEWNTKINLNENTRANSKSQN